MSCDWEGNRRSAAALAMRHRLKWFIHLRVQGLSKGDEHPTDTPKGRVSYSLRKTYHLYTAQWPYFQGTSAPDPRILTSRGRCLFDSHSIRELDRSPAVDIRVCRCLRYSMTDRFDVGDRRPSHSADDLLPRKFVINVFRRDIIMATLSGRCDTRLVSIIWHRVPSSTQITADYYWEICQMKSCAHSCIFPETYFSQISTSHFSSNHKIFQVKFQIISQFFLWK